MSQKKVDYYKQAKANRKRDLSATSAAKSTENLIPKIIQAQNSFTYPTVTERITKYISAVTLFLSKTKNVRAGQLRVSQRQRVKIAVLFTATWIWPIMATKRFRL